MEKKARSERTFNDYKGYSDIAQALNIPDTFIGSIRRKKFNTLIFDTNTNKFTHEECDLSEGCQRLFLEILSNAGDNCDASRRASINPGKIEINMDSKVISIKNGGLHIPVKKVTLKKSGGDISLETYNGEGDDFIWLPQFIFGQLRSSNNYDKGVKRMGCGRNGFGAKLTNIFSKNFKVIVEDPEHKLRFTGVWKDNMFKDTPDAKPEVEVKEVKSIKHGSVCIEWLMDFDRFEMESYSEKDIKLFARYAVDFSFTCKVITVFNGVELDFRSLNEYSKLHFTEEELKNKIVKYVWEDNSNPLNKSTQKVQETKILKAKNPEDIPELEIMIIDTPDKGKVISYVNGLMTVDGGVHVDASREPIFKHIQSIVNSKKKKKGDITISGRKIKEHLSFIVNARLGDPEYTSQSKTKLTSPNVSVEYPAKLLKSIEKWKTINRMFAELEAMAGVKAKDTDGRKKKHIVMDKGEDANYAGTKQSNKCTIYFVEGLSAANYPQQRICKLKGGKDYNGYMPLKGVFLNTTNASTNKYANNTVISNLKSVLGLKEGVDYTKDENISDLRYGFIMMTVDADDDGMHILALVLNFFREKFPGILKRNMVGYLRTPVIKVFKKDKIIHRFFSNKEFEEFSKKNSLKGCLVRYYKGLGTSNNKDIEDDLKTAPTVVCFYDSKCCDGFDLAFNENKSDQRKEWIENWRDVSQSDDVVSVDVNQFSKENELITAQDISQFLNRELIGFSVASLFRAIPSEYDHLKDSQRKAIWSALEYFKYDPKNGKSMKVGRFSNKSADMTSYHHGEKSLTDTIIKLAQTFIGSNNLGYFKKDGQFGTRADGGENAADARYSETHLEWWIPLVFCKESINLIERRIIEDEKCEPLWLPGVIPVGVVNGMNGIATAFSTTTPSFNPFDIIEWFISKCKGEETKFIKPWYKDFDGDLKVCKQKDNKIEVDTYECDDKLCLVTYGKYEIIGMHKKGGPIIKVTEIPVKTWIHDYRKWLESLIHSKDKIKPIFDFKDNSTTEKPHFLIDWNSNYKTLNHKNLKLIKNIGMSNITLIDHKGFPKKYKNIKEVLDKYYIHMLKHYNDVRDNRIKCEKDKVMDLSYKMKFIRCVLDGKIKIVKVKEDYIEQKMEEFEIPFEYYDKSKSRDFSEESLEKYEKALKESQDLAKQAESKTAQTIWLDKLVKLKKEMLKNY